jgi:hypothetical protein
MPDTIADAAVALSLILEALRLLNGAGHPSAVAHLRQAIDALSPDQTQGQPSSRGLVDRDEP